MNVGTLDRIIRLILGIALISLAYFGIIGGWGYIGIIPLATGILRWCPIYSIVGIQTCPLHETVNRD